MAPLATEHRNNVRTTVRPLARELRTTFGTEATEYREMVAIRSLSAVDRLTDGRTNGIVCIHRPIAPDHIPNGHRSEILQHTKASGGTARKPATENRPGTVAAKHWHSGESTNPKTADGRWSDPWPVRRCAPTVARQRGLHHPGTRRDQLLTCSDTRSRRIGRRRSTAIRTRHGIGPCQCPPPHGWHQRSRKLFTLIVRTASAPVSTSTTHSRRTSAVAGHPPPTTARTRSVTAARNAAVKIAIEGPAPGILDCLIHVIQTVPRQLEG
jgi:hypothetical protein